MRKLVISLLFGLVFSMVLMAYADTAQKHISDSVLRLHIVANSDSENDQNVKLKVRDALLTRFGTALSQAENREEAEKIINENKEQIKETAEKVLSENGCGYGAKAMCADVHFPVKKYENIMLPPGNYRALKVVLGNGAGKNWWCVMYPPLCFDTSPSGRADDDEILRKSLSESEYEIITESERKLPVKFRFKILEIFDKFNNGAK